MRPTKQIYSDYTQEDFKVWQTLYDRQMALLHQYASAAYMKQLGIVGFRADRIPNLNEVTQILQSLTGWSIDIVPNISPAHDFFGHLSRRSFTATCWLRTMAQLDYIEEPDMFHDVFAHIPLISDHNYAMFLEGLGLLAVRYAAHEEAIELIGRFYWFTIEFGLIREQGHNKIYGAGIMSSAGETRHCMGPDCTIKDFNIETILDTPYRNDIIQDTYFVIDSFRQLYHSLEDVEKILSKKYSISTPINDRLIA